MNQRIKKLWVKALRSGKFKQAREKMRRKVKGEYHYCCLGVLEQIRCEETGEKFKKSGNLLARVTWTWAGLEDNDPRLMPKRKKSAASLNDSGKSFKFIADRIEKYL